jgi:DNA polymerase-4
VDVDAFFAAVEQMDFPHLKGKPVIVGGTSKRGVVSTCSYEARAYGVHSAMPTFMAKKLCPDGIFLHGRHERYSEISHKIFEILSEVTEQIEKVSIDEAYLDVTRTYHSPEYIGRYIRETIKKRIGITVSVGISYNKFLAKLASEWDKPDGFFVIEEKDVPDILKPLPILKIHGLGIKSAERLNKIGIHTVDDLLNYSEDVLTNLLGSMGKEIYQRIRGIDERVVGIDHGRKSIGKEMTYRKDLETREELRNEAIIYLEKVCAILKKKDMLAKVVTLKIKYADFKQITRSRSLENPTEESEHFMPLLEELVEQVPLDQTIRLLGITLSGLVSNNFMQMEWFDLIGDRDDGEN